MAGDENKYNEWMSWVRERLNQQSGLENWLSSNKRMAEQEDAERRSHHIRANINPVLDFWNENKSESRSWTQLTQSQAIKNMISRYEQMLSVN